MSDHPLPGKARYKSRANTASRGKSDNITNPLPYYESPSAGTRPASRKSPLSLNRKLSGGSTSSSDYSEASDSLDEALSDLDASVITASTSSKKRSAMPSHGGADRRRLAIVQMETLQDAMSAASDTNSSASSVRSRRGFPTNLAGIALVAPPDASSKTYTHLTPPPTTRALGQTLQGHQRSASELAQPEPSARADNGPQDKGTDNNNNNSPVFNQQTTRPIPSPNPYESQRAMLSPMSYTSHHNAALSSAFSNSTPLITTPEIGASKEIHVPVAAPVIVDLASKNAIRTRHSNTPKPVTPAIITKASPVAPATPTTSMMATAPASFDPIQTSSFVRYQPGLDAIAGPLPPPPRLFDVSLRTPPPPRPPRLHSPAPPRTGMRAELEAVKQALQLPASVTSKLAKASAALEASKRGQDSPALAPPQITNDHDGDDASTPLSPTRSAHRREGAFLASPVVRDLEPDLGSSASSSSKSADSVYLDEEKETRQPSSDDEEDRDPTVTVEREEEDPTLRTPETIEEEEEDGEVLEAADAKSAVSESLSSSLSKPMIDDRSSIDVGGGNDSLREQTPSPEGSGRGLTLDDLGPHRRSSLSRSSSSVSPRSSAIAPSPPPKSFRHSLTTGLKRFSSLPRTPSLSARSAKRSSTGTQRSSRTPSPSIATRRTRRKIVNYNPPAMFCHEVYQQRTTAERCAIYAAKINELYIYDCGLSDWVVEMKYRTANHPPRGPSSQGLVPQPRHTSRSSMISEATFPRRPDAAIATDLSSQSSPHQEASPISVPASLPYQSLANQQRQQSVRSSASATSGTPPSSIRSFPPPSTTSSTKTGFFASLGRKASLSSSSRRDRGGMSLAPQPSNASRNALTKNHAGPTTKDIISRPILISNNHSVPSGPRALSSASSMRVQRSQTLMTTPVVHLVEREEVMARRPSLFNITDANSSGVMDIKPDPEFSAQVDKLQNLLPHADRAVLAGYLHRAGQDVLAIGQYLEDEKNGTLKFF